MTKTTTITITVQDPYGQIARNKHRIEAAEFILDSIEFNFPYKKEWLHNSISKTVASHDHSKPIRISLILAGELPFEKYTQNED